VAQLVALPRGDRVVTTKTLTVVRLVVRLAALLLGHVTVTAVKTTVKVTATMVKVMDKVKDLRLVRPHGISSNRDIKHLAHKVAMAAMVVMAITVPQLLELPEWAHPQACRRMARVSLLHQDLLV
jgi:uncharacterized membrane protein